MKEVRLAALAVAAAGALLAAVFFLSRALGPGSPAPTALVPSQAASDGADRRAQVEAAIAATPDIAPFFERLRATLPADYETALRHASAGPAGSPSDTPDYWLSDAVKVVRQSHGTLAAKAEGSTLSKIFARQSAVLSALATSDARLCVDFLYGGASEGFFRFAADNRALIADLASAGLDAVADGQAHKVEREPPTDADFMMLEDALRERGLQPQEITALLDGKSPDPPLPDARLCEMGRLYLDAIAALPEDARLRLYALAASLMARS